MNSIWSDFARMVYHVEVEVEVDEPAAAQQAFGAPGGTQTRPGSVSYSGGSGALQGAGAIAAAAAGAGAEFVTEYGDAEVEEAPHRHRAARRRRGRADRAQRPVLVRVGQEVQEVPRRVMSRISGRLSPPPAAGGALATAPP